MMDEPEAKADGNGVDYVDNLENNLNEPDMAAVYILLSCLAVSALVILGLLFYCIAQCWRQKFRHVPGGTRVPVIRISGASTTSVDNYLSVATCKTNGQPPWMDRYNSPSPKQRLLDDVDNNQNEPCRANGENGDVRRGSQASVEEKMSIDIERYELGYDKTHTSCFRGTLTFALRYDFIHRVLMVHVIRGNHLPQDRSGSSDPYVKMYLLPEMRNHCKTKIHRRTLDPEINEMFSFDVPFNSLASRMLQFTAYDFDRFTRHDLIGNVIMRDLFEKSDLYNWTEYTMHIVGNKDKEDFGVLLMYLSFSAADGKLIVTVAKAYNLRPMDITGASDPYVKVEQTCLNRRIKMRKTSIKRANLNPVYHETLEFDITNDATDRTNLLIQVMDWDRIGKDDLLGCCVLGPDSPTFEGREQWRECFAHPINSVHLYPPDGELGFGSTRSQAPKTKAFGKWHSLLADVPEQFRNISKK